MSRLDDLKKMNEQKVNEEKAKQNALNKEFANLERTISSYRDRILEMKNIVDEIIKLKDGYTSPTFNGLYLDPYGRVLRDDIDKWNLYVDRGNLVLYGSRNSIKPRDINDLKYYIEHFPLFEQGFYKYVDSIIGVKRHPEEDLVKRLIRLMTYKEGNYFVKPVDSINCRQYQLWLERDGLEVSFQKWNLFADSICDEATLIEKLKESNIGFRK